MIPKAVMRSHPTMLFRSRATAYARRARYVIDKYPYNMLSSASSGLLASVAGEALS